MKKFATATLLLSSALWAWSPLIEDQAAVEHSYGIFGNPALLPSNQASSWVASFTPNDSTPQIRAGVQAFGTAIGFQWSGGDGQPDQSIWSLSSSLPRTPSSLQIGLQGKAWRSSEFKGTAWSLSPGVVLRPFTFLSFGWTSQDGLATRSFPARHLFDIALQPVSPLVLGCAWNLPKLSKQGQRESNLTLHALLHLRGYELSGTVPLRGDTAHWSMAMGIPLGSYQTLQASAQRHGFHSVGIAGHLDRTLALGARTKQWVRWSLNVPIVESHDPLLPIRENKISLLDLRRQFEVMALDPEVPGVLLDFDNYTANAASSAEIRRGIALLRRHHKGTAAYLTELRPGALYAASQAERVILQPSARVHVRGLSSDVWHYKGIMDRLGIRADLLRHGRYKSAVEPFTQDTMSTEARADLQNLLNSLWNSLRDSIALSRHMTPARLDSIATSAPLTARAANALDLVDTTLYIDDIPEYLRTGPLRTWRMETRDLHRENWEVRPRIAIISLEGNIVDGPGGISIFGAHTIGSQAFSELIDQLEATPDIAAIVLRINSPGGSAQASDILWNRFLHLRQSRHIPMVTSVGNMAASGGYYIACASDLIVAEPISVVGSIGIFGGKVDASGLLNKISVSNTNVKTHPSADAESSMRGFTEEERTILQASMDDGYQRFLGVVSQARNMSPAHIDSLGEGRVFTGVEAKQVGLVDTLGGIDLAIRLAARQAGIPQSREVQTIVLSYSTRWNLENALLSGQASIPWQQWLQAIETPQVWALWPGERFLP